MASIATMNGGVVLNAAVFIGGNYLARSLSGGDKAGEEDKVRHDKALEAYQAAYTKYTRDCIRLLDWIATNTAIKEQAKQKFTNTDYAFKLYNQAHSDELMIPPKEPKFSKFTNQASSKNKAKSYLWGLARLLLVTLPFAFYEFCLQACCNFV